MHAGVSRHTAMPHVPSFPCDISVQRYPIDQMFISMRVPQIGWELETSRIRNDDMVRPRKFALHSMRGDRKNAVASGRSKKTRLFRKQGCIHETIQQFDGEQAEKWITRHVYHRVGGSEHRCGLRRAEQHERRL